MASRLPPLPSLKEILRLYRVRALKRLSQNFILDKRVCDKIVKAAGNLSNHEVIEVGPGPGNITRSILSKNVRKMVVIEKDTRFRPMLEMLSECSNDRMDIIWGDVMNFDMENSFSRDMSRPWEENPPDLCIIGNLPFNVSTHLIIRWLHAISERRSAWKHGRVRLTLTFQKEVAERMVAPILTSNRCRLSVMCQNYCHVRHNFTIKGSAFVPKPEVDVGVVTMTPMRFPTMDLPFKLVEKVVRCTFHYRRKYCIRGVKALFPPNVREESAQEMMRIADVDPETRPYQLTLPELNRLTHAYNHMCEKHPKLATYQFSEPKLPDGHWDDVLECDNRAVDAT